jgi:hypothetical protein
MCAQPFHRFVVREVHARSTESEAPLLELCPASAVAAPAMEEGMGWRKGGWSMGGYETRGREATTAEEGRGARCRPRRSRRASWLSTAAHLRGGAG